MDTWKDSYTAWFTPPQIEWTFTYEDGTEIVRSRSMSDEEMKKMYEEHGKVTVSVMSRSAEISESCRYCTYDEIDRDYKARYLN